MYPRTLSRRYIKSLGRILLQIFIFVGYNYGMWRILADLTGNRVSWEDELTFNTTSDTLRKAILNIFRKNPAGTNISRTTFESALKQLI